MRLTGNVIRVDRTAQMAEVAVGGVIHSLPVPIDDVKRPPPPLSQVTLVQTLSGRWRIDEVSTTRSLVLHEDWTRVNGAANPGTPAFADNVWQFDGNAGGAWGNSPNAPVIGSGVVEWFTDGIAGVQNSFSTYPNLYAAASDAIWFSAVGATYGTGALHELLLGFRQDAVASYVYLQVPNYQGAQLFQSNHGTTTNVQVPFFAQDDEFFDVDIVFVPGEFTAGWVNGTGPYVLNDSVGVGDRLSVVARVHKNDASINSAGVYCDWLRTERLGGVIHPDRLYDASLPACPV